METQIAAQEKALQEQLVAKKEEAIAAIDQAIEERKQKMSSLLSKYVNLLLNAALKYIETVLKIVGIDPDPVLEIIMKFKDAILTVVKDPISFFKDLGKAIGGGFKQFGQNAGQYLKETVLHWLGEKVGLVGIEFPKKFNLKGIIKLVASVLGVSWSGIKGMFGEFLGTDFVAKIESGVNFVKDLIADGPAHLKEWGEEKVKEKLTEKLGADKVQMIYLAIDFVKSIVQGGIGGMFDFIKEKAGEVKEMLLGQVDNIKTMVLGEIRNFILQKLINEGIKFLLSMLTPASGLAKAVELIFKVVQFFREQKDGLGALFTTIAQAIGLVFGGDVAGASSMIFKGILQAIPLLLDVIVNLLNLNNVFEKIKDVIAKVRGKVNDFIKSIVEWICKLLKGIWEKIKAWFAELKEKRKEKKAGKDNSENTPDYDDPEKKERVTKALDLIDTEQEQYTQDNKISKKDAKKVVKTVKASEEGKVFSKLKVIKGGDGKRWDYEWAASPTHVHEGPYMLETQEETVTYQICNSVGLGGVNDKKDVEIVQTLLQQHGYQLSIDGIAGQETNTKIKQFQEEKVGLKKANSRVDVDSKTWEVLVGQDCTTNTSQEAMAEEKDFLENFADASTGFANGVASELWNQISGLLKSIWELGKGAIETVKSIIKGELINDLKTIANAIIGLSWESMKNMLTALVKQISTGLGSFVDNWMHPILYERWKYRGKVLTAIGIELLMLIFTGGYANIAKWLPKIGQYSQKLFSIFSKLFGKIESKLPSKFKRKKKPGEEGELTQGKLAALITAEGILKNNNKKVSITSLMTKLKGVKLTFKEVEKFKKETLSEKKYKIWMIASKHDVGDHEEDDSNLKYNFKPPLRTRHKAAKVLQKKSKPNGPINTVVDNTVDMVKDTLLINQGKAIKLLNGKFQLPNGRIYGSHTDRSSDRIFPISGPGVYPLTRPAFNVLGILNKLGDNERTRKIISNLTIGDNQPIQKVDIDAALNVFNKL